VFDDTKVQLASAAHPKFKLDWVESSPEVTGSGTTVMMYMRRSEMHLVLTVNCCNRGEKVEKFQQPN